MVYNLIVVDVKREKRYVLSSVRFDMSVQLLFFRCPDGDGVVVDTVHYTLSVKREAIRGSGQYLPNAAAVGASQQGAV